MSRYEKNLHWSAMVGAALLIIVSLVAGAVSISEARTIVVKAHRGDPTRNCDRLLDELEKINNTSADNPALIKLRPGIYDCEGTSVIMKPFVDIEGSGQKTTLIRGSVNSLGSGPSTLAVVHGANDAELRNLTVENTCGAGGVCFALLDQATSMSIRMVTAITRSSGVSIAIELFGTATLDDVTAIAGSATISASSGISANGSATVEMNNVTATSLGGVTRSEGLAVQGVSTATARNSRFKGSFVGVNTAPSVTVNLVSTQLDGGSLSKGGVATFNCVAVYDKNFDALDENCDPIP